MRFLLIDRIIELHPGERITTSKCVALSEDYLEDHFPKFPVLPGVLMLEAMTESSAWLVRASEDFAHSIVVLKEARNVTYKSFVSPGQVLTIESKCKEMTNDRSVFAAAAHVDGRQMVKAGLILRHFNLADREAALASVDGDIRNQLRARFALLTMGSVGTDLA